MTKKIVWSPLIRILHWIMAVLTPAMFITAEAELTEYHVMMGPVLMAAAFIRIWIGFTGKPYERFSSFCNSPGRIIQYLKDSAAGTAKRVEGHNPLAGPVMLGIILLIVLNGISGFITGTAEEDAGFIYGLILFPDSLTEAAEVIHSAAGHLVMALIVLHLGGIFMHTLKYKEMIAKAMITGEKEID